MNLWLLLFFSFFFPTCSSLFFFLFFLYHSKGDRTKSYKKVGLYQQRFIGTQVAILATDHTGLTMKWGTKNILHVSPVWVRKFRSANLVLLSSQSGAFFFLKAWTSLLLWCYHLKTKLVGTHGFLLWCQLPP